MLSVAAKKRITSILYTVTFLVSAHYALLSYINSSYLENFVNTQIIGLLYVIASLITIVAVSYMSKLLKRLGQLNTVFLVLTIDLISVLTLAAAASPYFSKTIVFPVSDGMVLVENAKNITPWIPGIVIIAFLVFQICTILNRVLLDIYLEEFSKDSETGSNRGWYLTAVNLAFVIVPFIMGSLISGSNDGFWLVYLLSAFCLVLSHILVAVKLRHIKDVKYRSPAFIETFKKVWRDKNIFSIYVSSFLLEFFYSWMVIYTPIYLHEVVGFNWNQIGIIFGIMLLPFVILQLWLGKIADKYIGEKEILTAGFIIMGISTGILAFITGKSVAVWAVMLFITRVGAAAIEVMNDAYFFKKVNPTDSDIISFFRNASPVAYVVSPIVASLMLYFFDYKYLFLALGIITLTGIKFSLAIKDTL